MELRVQLIFYFLSIKRVFVSTLDAKNDSSCAEMIYKSINDTMSTYPMFARNECNSIEECAKICYAVDTCTSANYINDGYCELMSTHLDGPNDPKLYPLINSSSSYIEGIECNKSKIHTKIRRKRTAYFDLTKWMRDTMEIKQPSQVPLFPTVAPGLFKKLPSECGKPVVQSRVSKSILVSDSSPYRIVGGYEAVPHSYPWQVSLQRTSGSHFCGGTLIHPNYVLTAGHCVVGDIDLTNSVLILGAHNKDLSESTQVLVRAKKVVLHPEFEMTLDGIYNDFAVITLSKTINTTTAISPLCLSQMDPPSGTQCVVSGWGTLTSGTTKTPPLLQAVVVPLMNNTLCNDGKHYHGIIDSSSLCAGYENGGKDSCQGDSGGPLACYDSVKNQWSLVGVVSYGESCAEAYRPGVYARVTSAVNWIVSQIN